MKIDWNENINVNENWQRIQSLVSDLGELETRFSQVGEQDFLLQQSKIQSISEANVYLSFASTSALNSSVSTLREKFKKSYPQANYSFASPKNIFEYIFGGEKEELVARIYSKNKIQTPPVKKLPGIYQYLKPVQFSEIPLKETISIEILHEKLLLYEVDYNQLISELKTALGENPIGNLKTAERFIPIALNYDKSGLENIFSSLFVRNKKGILIPANKMFKIHNTQDYKTLTANKKGEYLAFVINTNKNAASKRAQIKKSFTKSQDYKVDFVGSSTEFKSMGLELILVVVVALFLLYFVMAAQFESLWQPLIIMLEIPINIGAGLLLLWAFGETINIMAAIGFVVMSGVVVNDSILKIHTINTLRKQGYDLKKAIFIGGELRLKSIVMTSLTTILGMLPILFIGGLGAELQRPLALIIIGGLLLGTFISLYLIPLVYHDVGKKLHREENSN